MSPMEEGKASKLRTGSRITAMVAALFGIMGVMLLYAYVAAEFADMPTRILWWAVISIVLCVLFLLAYAMVSDAIQSLEREARRKLILAAARQLFAEKDFRGVTVREIAKAVVVSPEPSMSDRRGA